MKNLLINRALAAKKKKIFTLLLAVAAGIGTMFASTKKIGDLYYNLDATNQTAEVIVGRELTPVGFMNYPSLKTATIPASVTYSEVEYSVTSIGDSAFYNCSLASVTIPNSVTSIGNSAFSGCIYLTSVTIGNSVTSIGNSAFSGCIYLTSVTIGNSVTSIGSGAFYGCKGLTSVTIPNSVTSIGGQAFYGCKGLTSVTIPNSVTSIGGRAFYGCTGLTSPVYNAHVFAFMPTSYSGAYTIADGIESIVAYAFYECYSLTSVTIPNSVTSIGEYTFSGCSSLTSVTIPNSVTSIGNYAFDNCSGLTSVTIPNSVTSIGNYAFSGCSGLTSVTIPNSVTNIGVCAFDYCSSLTSVTIPNSVTSIEEGTFSFCSGLTSVTIGNSVTSIGRYAFWECTGLTSVTIPNSVTSIGEYAFLDCTGLTSVTIGNSVTSIARLAFYGCSSLTSVTIEAETPPTLGDDLMEAEEVFGNTNNCPIYVPCSAVNAYKTEWLWSPYADRIVGNCTSDCANVNDTWLQTGGSGLGEMTTDNSGIWTYENRYGACAKANSGETGWLLTPAKDLSGMKSVNLSFLHVHKNAGTFTDDMTLWVCANYKGSVGASQWQQLTISPYSANNDWVYVNVSIDVPLNMVGANTVFGFKYISSNSSAKWEIKELNLNAECAKADETTTTNVTATPNEDNSVTLTWPAVNGADTYTIEIKKNGVSVCTLVFNANGQLISINFAAPARDGKGRNVPAAEQSANGWTYVVTGLEGNTSYTYSVTAKDANGNVLLKQSVDFSTGEEQGIEDVPSDQVQSTKVIKNGQIFILRGDKTYTLTGQETIMP